MSIVTPVVSLDAPRSALKNIAQDKNIKPMHFGATEGTSRVATAIVYCEGNFVKIDGKTANGLIRRSEKYRIRDGC